MSKVIEPEDLIPPNVVVLDSLASILSKSGQTVVARAVSGVTKIQPRAAGPISSSMMADFEEMEKFIMESLL